MNFPSFFQGFCPFFFSQDVRQARCLRLRPGLRLGGHDRHAPGSGSVVGSPGDRRGPGGQGEGGHGDTGNLWESVGSVDRKTLWDGVTW